MKKISKFLLIATPLFSLTSCSSVLNTLYIDMSPTTAAIFNAMIDESNALDQPLFDQVTLPDLYKRGTGYLKAPTKDSKGNPLQLASNYIEEKYNNSEMYLSTFTPQNTDYNQIIYYIHGGAYTYGAYASHVLTCDDLCQMSQSKVIMPSYPLAPQCTYNDAYPFMFQIYKDLLEENKPIYLMGDSAGGGFSVSLTMTLKANSIKLPEALILFSPWLDLTMSNPEIVNYESKDKMLAPYGLRKGGELWAGNIDLDDYRISPINGDVRNMPQIVMYTATNEIFYPDITKFAEKLKNANVKTDLIIGNGFCHAYPILNGTIVEAKQILQEIANNCINKN